MDESAIFVQGTELPFSVIDTLTSESFEPKLVPVIGTTVFDKAIAVVTVLTVGRATVVKIAPGVKLLPPSLVTVAYSVVPAAGRLYTVHEMEVEVKLETSQRAGAGLSVTDGVTVSPKLLPVKVMNVAPTLRCGRGTGDVMTGGWIQVAI